MRHNFEIEVTCPRTSARAGILSTPHGPVPTPLFLPVGSQGTVKTLIPEELVSLGAKMVLSNTYHLYLRPGVDIIENLGRPYPDRQWRLSGVQPTIAPSDK